ncbi:Eco57I restriction-modification methylase domain-containing protein [Pontibacter chinhatensis]|uniref:site-specific DNA-methyltransferase (adenine-specific) n=1 Tax=Pontibacter chinhatensis TaxID=1436961 RepID=A0A1I2QQT0_9BACT|nr:Eco57I restriction-modification methylase domain-containing protein [Pontibacter chinhatensis]SFG28617.1 N-6 DNA Methylase [Pontibacter chinhatensis]
MVEIFKQPNYLQALREFFKGLNVPINYIAEAPTDAESILGNKYSEANPAHQLIDDVYVLGLVDDAIFTGKISAPSVDDVKNADYDGILILGITLNNQNSSPTRSQLAEITRVFNSSFPYTPVTIVFKYGEYVALANSERVRRGNRDYREGEKIGKVSLLKDINVLNPHRGHIAIINQLKIETSGSNAVNTFSQLYFYWQSVFSISVLNKAFYQEIISWFNTAIRDIKIPSEKPGSEKHKDFTVRLIARLIFIWFLKELGVVKEELLLPKFNNGDLNNLIKPKAKGTAYYKFILQNLFFNALNCEQQERDTTIFDVFAGDYSQIEEIKQLIFYAPFLNGGLFDIHKNDFCEGNKINNAFSVPDHLFLDTDKGLNSILSKYKFTIAENTPLEEEIAVDPEMLGRIFENLLAEQSDDTKEAARRNTGAFYTPRPVVSYMCRSTLLKHLDIEVKPENGKQIVNKLLNTTILDPACGSGAFPMGMLEEMMQVLEAIDPRGNLWTAEMLKSNDQEFKEHISDFIADGQIRYVKKLGLLRSCLFGIDILEYAVEITKLRCWLSLIVEQKVDRTKPNYNLKPLPNLEFKFYKKNSLLRYYQDQNLNQLIDSVDNDQLLETLVNLENEYFIAKSSQHGNKEEIKEKIISLLEKIVDSKTEAVTKEFNATLTGINKLTSSGASSREIDKLIKKKETLAKELGELEIFRDTIKDYFIERVVFPGIFNISKPNPGFDVVIGNPPYVNTKQISKMGLTAKLTQEYGYCDDLYNHFTIRGLELLKKGGLLSYITSDTFLTLQTKKNLRLEFLGIPKVPKEGEGLFMKETECRVTEIINTPKAFSALVDTAIFTIKKEQAPEDAMVTYVDLRKPNATSFEISEEEWQQIKSTRDNIAGWERVLSYTFSTLGYKEPLWVLSHTCDSIQVFKDEYSPLLKFRLLLEPYRKAINFAIFSPTPYNCQILEKIIKPARPVFDTWWSKIEDSKKIKKNRTSIKAYTDKLNVGDFTILGLITDGGVGLQTGDNSRFIGYKSTSRFADRSREARVNKLFEVIEKNPSITEEWKILKNVSSRQDLEEVLKGLSETKIWQIFDEIKEAYGLRVFGKGFIYRIIPPEFEFDLSSLTDEQKSRGIKNIKSWVPYDKGDREGNRWYLETPFLVDWGQDTVSYLARNSGKKGTGMPVVRNPQFYFRNGFCWNESLNPNSSYIKCRLKSKTVHDVSSMSLFEESGLGDEYIVLVLNSFLSFKLVREFYNNTVKIQMNDIRKLPIKIPTDQQLAAFRDKFNECLEIKKQYFGGKLERRDANDLLKPIEREIDEMVNNLYGITVSAAITADEEFDEELVDVLDEELEEEEVD